MKKLIVVAVAVFSMVAMAGNCSPEPVQVKDTSWVYHWKFTGKTTMGKSLIKTPQTSACSPVDAPNCTYRSPASLKIEGYTYACNPGCGADGFETFAEQLEVFWATKPWRSSFAGGVSTEVSHIIGKAKKQYECSGTATFTDPATDITYNFIYSGLGKYDLKNNRVKSVEGKFAGTATRTVYAGKNTCTPIYAGCWDCSSLQLICDEQPTVVFGKWTCKYKKDASKKYAKTGRAAKTPRWVEILN